MQQSKAFLGLEVEALIGEEWIPVHAHESRHGATGPETLVSWDGPEGRRGWVRQAWIENTKIRPVQLDR